MKFLKEIFLQCISFWTFLGRQRKQLIGALHNQWYGRNNDYARPKLREHHGDPITQHITEDVADGIEAIAKKRRNQNVNVLPLMEPNLTITEFRTYTPRASRSKSQVPEEEEEEEESLDNS